MLVAPIHFTFSSNLTRCPTFNTNISHVQDSIQVRKKICERRIKERAKVNKTNVKCWNLEDNKLDLNKLQEDPLSLIHSGVIYYLRGNMKPLQLTAWCQTSQSSKFLFEGEISNMNSFPSTDCISYYYPLTVCFFVPALIFNRCNSSPCHSSLSLQISPRLKEIWTGRWIGKIEKDMGQTCLV